MKEDRFKERQELPEMFFSLQPQLLNLSSKNTISGIPSIHAMHAMKDKLLAAIWQDK